MLTRLLSMTDAFGRSLDFEYALNAPIPFLEDLFDSQLEFLREKNKAIAEASKAASK